MLIVLDDVYQEATARQLMKLGPRCVYLITTRAKGEVAGELGWPVKEISELDGPSGFELLKEIAPEAVSFDPHAATKLVAAVQGLPLALVLVGKYLHRESLERDPDLIRLAFQNMGQAGERLKQKETRGSGQEKQALADIIDVSYQALKTDAARSSFRKLSIFRPKPNAFSKEIANRVCDADIAIIKDISSAGLIEHYSGGDYTMHRVIAEYARTKLTPDESVELHYKALAYYAEKLESSIDYNLGSYLGWYRYEKTGWQAMKEAWLYHLAHTGDMRRSVIAFLQVYLDAFWWWGYYQPFPFCEGLIQEWWQRELHPWLREGLIRLKQFQEAYPAGYDKRVGRSWDQVENALSWLRTQIGLDGDVADIGSADARRVRAFLDFFLAEAIFYGRNDWDAALALYQDSHDLFVKVGADWEAAWIWFYVAQSCLENSNISTAREYCQRALAAAREEQPLAMRDPELFANIYRLMGDLDVAQRDIDAGTVHYCRATFYAYVFQAIPESPDSYTMAFYREIRNRVAGKAFNLVNTNRRKGRAFCTRLRKFWEPYWTISPGTAMLTLEEALAAGSIEALADYLFPLSLNDHEIRERGVEYQKRVLGLIDTLKQRLEMYARSQGQQTSPI